MTMRAELKTAREVSESRIETMRKTAHAFYALRLGSRAEAAARDWRQKVAQARNEFQQRLDDGKMTLSKVCIERNEANARATAMEAKRAEEEFAASVAGLGAKLQESTATNLQKEIGSLHKEQGELKNEIAKLDADKSTLEDENKSLHAKLQSSTAERKKLVQKTAEIFKTMAARQLKEKDAELLREKQKLASDFNNRKEEIVANALAESNKRISRLAQEAKAQKWVSFCDQIV